MRAERRCSTCKKTEGLPPKSSRCRTCQNEYQRKRLAIPANRARYNELVKKALHAQPEKVKARRVLNLAVKRGEVIRPNMCQCGCLTEGKVEGHHPDYSRPLAVVWLLRAHHADLHSGKLKVVEFSGFGDPVDGFRVMPATEWSRLQA